MKAVEQNLRMSVRLVKQEFSAVAQGEAKLLEELREKFKKVETAVGVLQYHAQTRT